MEKGLNMLIVNYFLFNSNSEEEINLFNSEITIDHNSLTCKVLLFNLNSEKLL